MVFTDETQSQYTHSNEGSESSSLSKQMYMARAQANKGGKKDLQAFMREKLQKTKIASESVATAQLP